MRNLTKRHRELLALVKIGCSNPEIALKFDLSVKTVENHLSMAYKILGVKNRQQAVYELEKIDRLGIPISSKNS